MADKYKFTEEAKVVFQHLKTKVLEEYPTTMVTPMFYVYSVLCNKKCTAYETLAKVTSEDNLSLIEETCRKELADVACGEEANAETAVKYDEVYDNCLSDCAKDFTVIDSAVFLLSVICKDKGVSRFFSRFGITVSELQSNKVEAKSEGVSTSTKQRTPSKKKNEEIKKKNGTPKATSHDVNEVEKNLTNVNDLAMEGKIDEAIGNDSVIDKIFTALLKRDRNNVILVGESGSGKTCTVEHIANLINEGNVPKYFTDKVLMKLDFMSLVSGTALRGGFETKYQSIVTTAAKSGKYIFFLDDIHSILSSGVRFSEVSTDVMLEDILSNNDIMFITTTTFDGYSKYIMPNKALSRRFEKIVLEEKKGDDLTKIIQKVALKYEKYHNVKYSNDFITKAIELSERFLGGSGIYTVTDLLDSSAANELMKCGKDTKMDTLKKELTEIDNAIDSFDETSEEYEAYDDLCRKRVEKQSEINQYEKDLKLTKKTLTVHVESLYKAVSEKSGVPVGNITTTERERLKNMDKHIKEKVIGQDDAVETICRSVRRQRVGINNPDAPNVFLFVGNSGVGKSYLSKKLAEEVFGDEKSMVRLDMSEYSDKISTNKLIGSASGYVGYDDGGLLTEAIKKNNHCVLLLDEIEKANEEIFNIFLQVFDEGRLTDNKGVTVDFRNVIIIMTSNIGTKEAADFKPIGFGDKKEEVVDKSIIMKTIKKKLPPEFINRIDEIVFFNKLTDDNLKEIIKIEIGKVEKRVEKLGYHFNKTLKEGRLVEDIFKKVKKESEYGARPILREIQRQLEDKLTDILLNKNLKKDYTFTDKDIYQEIDKIEQ